MKGRFQYDLCEYLLVVSPPNWVNWEVEDIKQEFAMFHGEFQGLHTVPHISLLNLILHKSQEENVVNKLLKKLSAIEGFDVVMDGYDFFEESNAFSIKVKESAALLSLHNFLVADLYVKQVMMSPANRNFNPHLAIGRKLSDRQFRNAYHEFRNKEYTNYFRVNSLTLLKRKGPVANWTFFADIPLKVEEGCVVYA